MCCAPRGKTGNPDNEPSKRSRGAVRSVTTRLPIYTTDTMYLSIVPPIYLRPAESAPSHMTSSAGPAPVASHPLDRCRQHLSIIMFVDRRCYYIFAKIGCKTSQIIFKFTFLQILHKIPYCCRIYPLF